MAHSGSGMQVPSAICRPFQQLEPAQASPALVESPWDRTFGKSVDSWRVTQRRIVLPEDSSDSYRVVRINSKSMSPTARQVQGLCRQFCVSGVVYHTKSIVKVTETAS